MLVGVSVSRFAAAAPGEDDTPIANPDLPLGCGIDIHVILDESGSIANAGATDDVQRAFGAFTQALKNTGSRMAVSEFSTVARLPLGGSASRAYTTVTDATIAATFDPYINTQFNPSGSTHWEDAFRMGRYFLPRPSQATPHLVVFITDGDPNEIVREDRVTYSAGNPVPAANEYELKVPLAGDVETENASENPAKDRAVPNANALKAQGSHILTIAVGNGLQSAASLARIIAVSGPDVFSPTTGAFDIATTDVYRQPDFSLLEDALREAAFQLCAPSVNVRKLVDANPDPAVDDLQPGNGWSMTATVAPTPATWVLPAGATGATATSTTGADGFVTFQWTTAAPVDSTIAVTEVVQPGFVNDPSATTCTYRTPDSPADQPLPGFSATSGGFSGTVPDESIVTCQIVNRIPPAPAVDLEKFTNGIDADMPPGPPVPVGADVDWTYRVTNTGNLPLSSLSVTDNQGVAVTCPVTTLAAGQETTCTAGATGVAGQYANTGTVTASSASGAVTDSDPSHYFGVMGGIDIEKATNGDDADSPPGPLIPSSGAVAWTYVVRNIGNVALSGIAVTDSEGVAVTCPQTTLAVGGVMTCAAADTADPGQYENVGSVTGTTPTGGTVQDSDPSHYFGEAPAVDIEKLTNGVDADEPTGPLIPVRGQVTWSYRVTNTGNVPLQWTVTDLQAPFVACPRLLLIVPGQTIACFSQSTAIAGQYANVGAVVGTSPSGATVDDSDPSHYFGVQGSIDIEKLTNGDDADEAPGPFIPVGGLVSWTFRVTNTGNSPLTAVEVVDLRAVAVSCPQTTLAASELMVCTATGIAGPDQYTNLSFVSGETPLGEEVRDDDPSHYFGATPGVSIQKYTNGDDADEAPGPLIAEGGLVEWTYVVKNSGNVGLSGIAVTDDQGVAVTCPVTTLAPGEEMSCAASGTAGLGQYANVGSVTASAAGGGTLTDSDPSHYFGFTTALDIEKLTNGEDADLPSGPSIPVGGPVTWTYRVTTPGNIAVRGVTVTDDRGVVPAFNGGDADGDRDLDPGETWTYSANGTAAAGQYANTATATGLDVLENPLTDSDPSHYFGATTPAPPGTSSIRIVKRWLRARAATTIYVDRDGTRPYDASARADSNGDQATFTYPVSTQATVGETPVPRGYTATINCGSGPRAYSGRPVTVTSPSQAGATLVCTVVNRAPPPVLVIAKKASKRKLRADQTVDFTIRVTNRGPGMARNVTICDRLPDGLVFVRAPGARFSNGDACWRVVRLRDGRSKLFRVRVRSMRTERPRVLINVVTVTPCASRRTFRAGRVAAVCSARALVAVLPRRARRGGGVTG